MKCESTRWSTLSFIIYLMMNVKGQVIHLYSDHYKQGTKVEVSIAECSNLPEGMAGEVTSIDTRDNCARFFDGWNCSGHSIEVMPRSPSHHNLYGWDFNDRALSVGPCRDVCSQEITGHELEKGQGVPEEEVLIFSRKQFKGAYAKLGVKGCTLIPVKFTRTLLSVKTSAKCLQFYNNHKCEHKGRGKDSIELRQGTPYHDDIHAWAFFEARAVSHCSYKCGSTQASSEESEPPEKTSGPADGEVMLFDAQNFEGNWVKIKLNQCVDLSGELGEWEGVAVSVKTFEKACVTLYDKRGCEGDFLNVVSSNGDLSQRNFDALTRSFKPCDPGMGASGDESKTGDQNPESPQSASSNDDDDDASASLSASVIAIVVTVPLLGVILSVFVVLLVMRKCHPYKKIMDMLSEQEIQEFLNGLGLEIREHEGASNSGGSGDYSAELLAQNRPYDAAYEIPLANIKFDTRSPLGKGEFGIVYKGSLTVLDDANEQNTGAGGKCINTVQVAVKTVRPDANIQYLRSLLKEVKIMLYAGKHENVVQFVGCCTQNLKAKGEILVLVEFCSKGSLESFLQKNRGQFTNLVVKGKLDPKRMQEKLSNVSKDSYLNLTKSQDYQNCTTSEFFDNLQLLRWCIEVAKGMEFLASRKVIHSDLATRNVLLNENYTAKISDFGLSKQLYCYTQYVKKRQEPLPWRWLALESLKDMEFSTKSDIWGYGVLCWEVFTLAEKPYPGTVWSNDFIRNLEDGLRLQKPKYATTECYNLMVRCWDENPNSRPDFTELREELEEILSDAFKIHYSPPSRVQSNLMYAILENETDKSSSNA